MKLCKRCSHSLDIDKFSSDKSRKDELSPYCKECNKKNTIESKQRIKMKDPSTGKTIYNRKVHNNGLSVTSPGYIRDRTLKKLYGITLEIYNDMKSEQDNKCAICRKHINDLIKPLAVDHEHYTGKIRGLLCVKCNIGIGCFQDDPELLRIATSYLTK